MLAEADEAACEDWGSEISTVMDKIRLLYGYDYSHDASPVEAILKELAAADAVRTLLTPQRPTPQTSVSQRRGGPHVPRAPTHLRR